MFCSASDSGRTHTSIVDLHFHTSSYLSTLFPHDTSTPPPSSIPPRQIIYPAAATLTYTCIVPQPSTTSSKSHHINSSVYSFASGSFRATLTTKNPNPEKNREYEKRSISFQLKSFKPPPSPKDLLSRDSLLLRLPSLSPLTYLRNHVPQWRLRRLSPTDLPQSHIQSRTPCHGGCRRITFISSSRISSVQYRLPCLCNVGSRKFIANRVSIKIQAMLVSSSLPSPWSTCPFIR